jgi:transcriptional regulator with XRE-family HTH domain
VKPLIFLKSARLARHMTQAQLAARVGVDASHISRLESGHGKGVSMEVVQAVARELGVTVSYLFGEEAREAEKEYGEGHPARAILTDYHAPQGLRDFAADKALADALRVTPDEWRALLSLELPTEVSKDGYVQLLITIRAISKSPGYHVAQP